MKKLKKIFAALLTLAMVLGMSMTTFAAEDAAIEVNNAENASLTYAKLIQTNQTTKTGWEFVNDQVAKAYMEAFGVGDAQTAIIMLAKAQDENAYNHLEMASDVRKATAAEIDKALSNVVTDKAVAFQIMQENPLAVDEAGIYAVRAEEEGYTYKTMAAYVGFGEAADGTYPILKSDPITAKKSPTKIEKENLGDAADNAVAIGDTVEFKVTANFPYFDPNVNDNAYIMYDVLVGADFNQDSVKVTIGSRDVTRNVDINFDVKANRMVINFNALIDDANTYANELITVTYTAVVKELNVNNSVAHSISDDTAETNLYTGNLTITKYAEDGETTLKGAEFVVAGYFTEDDEDTGDNFGVGVKYATFDDNNILTGWVDNIDEATHVITGEDGTVAVYGLNEGDYMFFEVKAPEGYSINEEPAGVTLTIGDADTDGDGKADKSFEARTSMSDTKLSALPSTGGIGTTIFTIGGCAIMIIAAGLFFASRRKSSK